MRPKTSEEEVTTDKAGVARMLELPVEPGHKLRLNYCNSMLNFFACLFLNSGR
jgi:hypothetical protein